MVITTQLYKVLLNLPKNISSFNQYKVLVKVHRVFPSRCSNQAFSPSIQFHRIVAGDSEAVVTPFMQDGTYPPMNFATFGPSGYSRRLLGLKSTSYTCNLLSYSTGQASDSIHHCIIQQSPVFLVNSRHLLFYDTLLFKKSSLSRSYRVNLPSSFNYILPSSQYSLPTHQCQISYYVLYFHITLLYFQLCLLLNSKQVYLDDKNYGRQRSKQRAVVPLNIRF